MIGRAPMMTAPVYAMEGYPTPQFMNPPQQFVGQPAAWPSASWQPQMSTFGQQPAQPSTFVRQLPTPSSADLARAAAPRPIIRAKGDDEPAPRPTRPMPLTLPSPESLGIARAPATASVDWSATRTRLDRVGVIGFNLERLSPAGYRFTCLMPTSQPGRTHRVEAVAATEADVVRLALAKSEEWAGGK
jgi:hypothetical protein